MKWIWTIIRLKREKEIGSQRGRDRRLVYKYIKKWLVLVRSTLLYPTSNILSIFFCYSNILSIWKQGCDSLVLLKCIFEIFLFEIFYF
jgi:hypothetical protein